MPSNFCNLWKRFKALLKNRKAFNVKTFELSMVFALITLRVNFLSHRIQQQPRPIMLMSYLESSPKKLVFFKFLSGAKTFSLIFSCYSNSTVLEWTRETTKNIGLCKQEIKCCMSLRSYVEILFKQVVEDISNQFNRTNEQFRSRMEEMRYAKMKLEGLHCGTANQVYELKTDTR